MNSRKLVLILFISNAAFAGAFFLRPNRGPAAPEASASVVTNVVVRRVSSLPEIVTQTEWRKLNWSSVEAAEYPVYIANLRAIGCPEETIRDIIIADVNKLYATKWRAEHGTSGGWKFWEGDHKKAAKEARHSDERQEMEEERANLISELLGVDLRSEMKKYAWDPEDKGDRRYSFLSDSRQEIVRDLDSRYKEAVREILDTGKAGNESRESIEAKLADLRRQHQAELAGAMTAQEFQEYQLRNSNLADRLRKDLAGVEPSEQEFRALFSLLNKDQNLDGLKSIAWNDPAIQGRLAKELGADRAAEIVSMSDPEVQKTAKLVQKMGGTVEDANRVLAISQVTDQAIAQALNNPNLNEAERAAAVEAIKKEKKTMLSATLGTKTRKKRN